MSKLLSRETNLPYCFFCRFASLAKLQNLIAETNTVDFCGICLPIVFLFVSFKEI